MNINTLNDWFAVYMAEDKSRSVRRNTIRNIEARWTYNIGPILGDMPITEIRPLDCQSVLNRMFDEGYAVTTMNLTRSIMHNIFESALGYEVISENPVKRSVRTPPRPKKEQVVLNIDEQQRLIEYFNNNDYIYEHQVRFILQTGLRIGELTALKWKDVDFENSVINISATMEYVPDKADFVRSEPKSLSAHRSIYLTDEAKNVLRVRYLLSKSYKDSPYADYVFLNDNGMPIKLVIYDGSLKRLAKRVNIRPFSMHALRRTFASRCAESGMLANVLQSVMGHSDITTTLRYYVKLSEDEKAREMMNFENYLKGKIQ